MSNNAYDGTADTNDTWKDTKDRPLTTTNERGAADRRRVPRPAAAQSPAINDEHHGRWLVWVVTVNEMVVQVDHK